MALQTLMEVEIAKRKDELKARGTGLLNVNRGKCWFDHPVKVHTAHLKRTSDSVRETPYQKPQGLVQTGLSLLRHNSPTRAEHSS